MKKGNKLFAVAAVLLAAGAVVTAQGGANNTLFTTAHTGEAVRE